jgi:hypothetical protein
MDKSDSTRPRPAVFIIPCCVCVPAWLASSNLACPAQRNGALAKLVRKASWAVQLNEHIAERGDIVFRHACKLGFEGIVSKRVGSPYRSGRSRHWVKSKNPQHPAVKREAEDDWTR